VAVDSSFAVEILLPDGALEEIAPGDPFSGRSDEIIFPGLDGMVGIRRSHAPMLAGLDIGDLMIVENRDGKPRELHFACGTGIVEVVEGGDVAIYLSVIEFAGDIDLDRAEESLRRAEQRIREKPEGFDHVRAEAAMKRALNRLDVAHKHGGR